MAELRGIVKALDADHDNRVIDIEEVPDEIAERGHYTCLLCGSDLIAKKGTKRMHHFAHHSATECDSWASGMTEWHLTGQRLLEARGAKLEVPFEATDSRGRRHRIDALVEDSDGYRTGIEFQHSPMGRDMFDVRNDFYLGELDELVWVFDVRGRDVSLGREYRYGMRDAPVARGAVTRCGSWKHPPEWFSPPCLASWYGRRLTVFLYMDGRDDWSDGRIIEVISPALGSAGYDSEIWLGQAYPAISLVNELGRRGSFVGRNRMHTLAYAYHDGTGESFPVRHGMPLPVPRHKPDAPEGKEEHIADVPRRMPPRDLVLRQELRDRQCHIRIVGSGCTATVAYGSTRDQALDAVRAGLVACRQVPLLDRIDANDIPPVIRGDVTLRPRRAEPRLAKSAPSRPSRSSPMPTPVARRPSAQPARRQRRHRVTFVDDNGAQVGFVDADDGSPLRDAAISMHRSLKVFGTAGDYEWPKPFLGHVPDDMTITLPRKSVTVHIAGRGGAGGNIDLSVSVPRGTPLAEALRIAREQAGRSGDAYGWEVPRGTEPVDGDAFVHLVPEDDPS